MILEIACLFSDCELVSGKYRECTLELSRHSLRAFSACVLCTDFGPLASYTQLGATSWIQTDGK